MGRTNKTYKRKKRRSKFINRKNAIMKELASERIEYLMQKAFAIYSKNPELAERYVLLSRRYSMAAKVPIPKKYKRNICNKCKKLMVPGVTSRHRIQSRKKNGSRYVYTCLHCGNMTHIYFKSRDKIQKKKEIITEKVKVKEINTTIKDN